MTPHAHLLAICLTIALAYTATCYAIARALHRRLGK
jgi:hypothetical protein